jgi:hypothetical protein
MLLLAVSAVPGCTTHSSAGIPRAGSFLRPTYGSMLTDRNPVPPGQRFAIMLVPVTSQSARPVELQTVRLTGTGIGTVAKVVSVSAGPDVPGHATPTTTFVTDPPVFLFEGHCLVQRLEPFDHLVVHQGQDVRLYVVLQATQPGRLRTTGYQLTYTVNGTTYTQDLPVGYTTWVRKGVPPRAPHPQERACLSHSHLL